MHPWSLQPPAYGPTWLEPFSFPISAAGAPCFSGAFSNYLWLRRHLGPSTTDPRHLIIRYWRKAMPHRRFPAGRSTTPEQPIELRRSCRASLQPGPGGPGSGRLGLPLKVVGPLELRLQRRKCMIRHISVPVVGPQWHRSDLFCYNPATRSAELEGESAVTQVSSGSRVVDQARDALAAFVRNAPEGSKLPPERELAQKLGVSRTTLRDGVSRLALLGLLEVRHGDGTYVRSPDASQLALPFRSLLEYNPEAPGELLALKRLLEPELAAQAARNASEEDVAALRGAVQQERSELVRQGEKRRPGRRQAARRSLETLMIKIGRAHV